MIGILPAAGTSERFYHLPKMLLPVGDELLITRHIRMMRAVGIEPYVMCASGPKSLASHLLWDYNWQTGIAPNALIADHSDTMSETVLSKHGRDENVIFGMPDSYIEDSVFPTGHDLEDTNIYQRMAMKLDAGADLVVGIFPAREDQKSHVGMVDVKATEHGYIVIECVDKPEQTGLHYGWGTLGWKPIFWQFIKPEDPHVGYAIPRAIEAGLDIRIATMHSYWDCGTPERYFALIRHLTEER